MAKNQKHTWQVKYCSHATELTFARGQSACTENNAERWRHELWAAAAAAENVKKIENSEDRNHYSFKVLLSYLVSLLLDQLIFVFLGKLLENVRHLANYIHKNCCIFVSQVGFNCPLEILNMEREKKTQFSFNLSVKLAGEKTLGCLSISNSPFFRLQKNNHFSFSVKSRSVEEAVMKTWAFAEVTLIISHYLSPESMTRNTSVRKKMEK